MEFRTSKVKTSERIQAEVEVEITSPRSKPMDPPEYGDTGDMGDTGDTAQSIDAHLGIPANLADELPSYARYET
ncbi:hypothetical protein BGZ80_010057 [Entomortierella chlamydospora]|uniref:Uncharacterized protein n=1 Tax=Entomortierella chlamydospora TaxID=101097 RepID=A0A9P6MVK5_9FUNG|nr:hypothetical protein BGZ80_010057 [Entomortierella chlamydospora]